jgi:A/G-specific adenine glycosylase
MSEHGGVVPDNEEVLRSLPGIGEYTAAAIVAFAFKKKSLVLDTNIRRLFSRAFDGVEYPPLHITNLERERSASLIPKQAATWAAATMELGALICTAKNPVCDKCPIRKSCFWREKGFPKTLTLKTSQVWHGSNRQCRGVIMKALRTHSSITYKALKANWPDESQFENALQSLLEDRLIIKHKKKYQLIE